ncbi:MAG: beta strand repeat-containing protein, partial [Burkholderiales bacterium]
MELRKKILVVAVASCFAGGVNALPTAPTVAAGAASFAQRGKTLTVTNTPGSIINWQGFSIGQGEATRFIQQSAASAVLNRVTGGDPSTILGQLQSNGRVFLINPNGITFGAGSQIDVAGLVASSLHMADADFLNGRFKFSGTELSGQVVNRGEIRTPEGGKVWLIAPKVENSGLITTPTGEIILAAGKSIEITDPRNASIRVQIEAPDGEALNIGQLIAKSGVVGMYGKTVRASGTISANAAVVENGKVVFKRNTEPATLTQTAGTVELKASDTLSVEAGAKISADGPKAGKVVIQAKDQITLNVDTQISANGVEGGDVEVNSVAGSLLSSSQVEARGSDGPGGRVALTGQHVGILQRSRIDASGDTGGGVVLIGGDFQGTNPDVQNSKLTYVAPDAQIHADALTLGNGGKVVVWADNTTRYYGTITARGGANGGDGGFVEVSGKDTLVYKGNVDTRAPQGKTGMLLLDPANIIIANGSGDSADDGADVSTTSFAGDPSGVTGAVTTGDNPPGGTLTLFESELEGISAATNISLAATNAITINDLADNNLNLAQTGGGSVSFNSASFSMNAGDTITTAGAAINLTTTGSSVVGGINAAGGAITLNVGGTSSVNGVIAGSGTALNKLGAGTLTLGGANTYTGTTTVSAGTLTLSGGSAIPNAGAVNLDTSGAVLNVANAEVLGSLAGVSGTTVNLNTGTLTAGDAGNATFSGIIQGSGNVIKAGTGTWTLSGSNTYSGLTTINAGTLKLGAAGDSTNTPLGTTISGTLVRPGAALDLNGFSLATAEALTLNGTGVASGGALTNSAGAASYSGLITLGMASSIVTSAGDINITNPGTITGATFGLTLGGSGNGSIASVIGTTSGTLTKNGAGTWTVANANTYTGVTTVNAGTLRYGANNAILTSNTVTVNDGGTLALNDFSGTIGALTVNSGVTGGQVTTGTGTLTLGGNVTSTGGGTNASINGKLDLGAATRTITATNTADGINVSAVISGPVGLTSAGTGTVTLSGANTYTGVTTVSTGTLKLGAAGDATNTPLGTIQSGTTVSSGAALDLNGFTLGTAEPLTLSGTGVSSSGALTNSSAGA